MIKTMILQSRPISADLQLLIVSGLDQWLSMGTQQSAAFPGVLLLERGAVVMAIGFSVDAAGHCTATLPICVRPLDERTPTFVATCYSQLSDYVTSSHLKSLRCLLDSTTSPATLQLLQRCSWQTAATIVRWALRMSEERWLAFASTAGWSERFWIREVDVHTTMVDEILTEALADSQDLPVTMRPSARELILNWDALAQGYQAMGVSSLDQKSELAGLLVFSTIRDARQTNIEYIGVRTGFRRSGVARTLIRQVLQKTLVGEIVTAYADAANDPANRLYERCGFEVDGRWMLLNWDLSMNTRQQNEERNSLNR